MHRGVALVAVLSVLTILAILAVAFYMQTSVESLTSEGHTYIVQANLLAQSALEHASCLLRDDAMRQPAFDDYSEDWHRAFRPLSASAADGCTIDGDEAGGTPDARWFYLHDHLGRLIGRYAVLMEDECGKIHLNIARALGRSMQGEGVGTFELILSDGQLAGVPLSLGFAKNILRYRYGRDRRPGQANVDDNNNAVRYGLDRIDNNANGQIDEPDEGLDEPEEYNHINPVWDDRALSSLRELASLAPQGQPLSQAAQRIMRNYATLHAQERPGYWEPRDAAWRAQLHINSASRRQLQSALNRANSLISFEPSDTKLRVIVANMLDYRDENQVLTTVGSEYGIESVCFNEIMANDGGLVVRADRNNPAASSRELVHRYGWWYELVHLQKQPRSFRYGWKLERVSGGGSRASVRLSKIPTLSTTREGQAFEEFLKMSDNLKWIPDMWKNACLMVYKTPTNVYDNYYVPYLITGNSEDDLQVRCSGPEATYNFLEAQVTSLTGVYNAVMINNFWRNNPGGLVTVVPEVTETLYCPINLYPDFSPPPDTYYNVFIGENNLPGTIVKGTQLEDRNVDTHYLHAYEPLLAPKDTPYKGFHPYLDTDGEPRRYSETRMLELTQQDLKDSSLTLPGGVERAWLLRTPYNNGEAVRAKDGYVRVTVSTCRDAGAKNPNSLDAYRNKNVVQNVLLLRPDILELHNISDHPVSLANWRIVINTGSYADQVGRIRSAMHFSAARNSRYDNPNPVIEPGGYFYLTNHRNIFDLEHGGLRDGTWGNSRMESYPCAEMPDFLWGVRYEVTDVRGGKVRVKGANWRRDQLKYEMTEWLLREPRADQNSPYGIINTIVGNTRDTLDYGANVNILSLRAGDDVLIRGMPRQGGFVSMTLRTEYNQIAARTIEYASVEPNEYTASSIKLDPARYTWTKSRVATIGGHPRAARNPSARQALAMPRIKNNPYATIAEVQKVRAADDWRTLGTIEGGKPGTTVLRALAPYFTTAGVRLDAEEDGAHVSGWRPAFAAAKSSSLNAVTADDALWQPNVWNAQTLRVLNGALRGESFCISSNSDATIHVQGYSVPRGVQLRLARGDRFALGPGFTSAMFYTRRNGDEGIWEWKNKGLERGAYALYIGGVNDSIITTEFLEENHNAEMQIGVFNFETREYDELPRIDTATRDYFSSYLRGGIGGPLRYDKTDNIFCGIIGPEHISPFNGIRLKIVPRGLDDPRGSGFAWFDYAILAPCLEYGRININTASERVLNALNGFSPKAAQAVRLRQQQGKPGAFARYERSTDMLNAEGITPELFAKNANLITTRSDQFRARIIAQSLRDADGDGAYDAAQGDAVMATVRRDVVIDRSELMRTGAAGAPLRVTISE